LHKKNHFDRYPKFGLLEGLKYFCGGNWEGLEECGSGICGGSGGSFRGFWA